MHVDPYSKMGERGTGTSRDMCVWGKISKSVIGKNISLTAIQGKHEFLVICVWGNTHP